MPGNVQSAVPIGVMPHSLCLSFEQIYEYEVNVNEYSNGEAQREVLATNTRKRWKVKKRLFDVQATWSAGTGWVYDPLAKSALVELQDFFILAQGAFKAFYFYDPHESTPLGNYDPTGADTNGRFLVRFEKYYSQEITKIFGEVELEIVEIA